MIKTFYISLMMIIVFALASNETLHAQGDSIPPCIIDCYPQSPWIPDSVDWYQVDPVNCPACSIKFNYWYRIDACGIYNDIQLGDITFSLACSYCQFTTKDLVDFARDKMIRDSPIPKPNIGQCYDYWRAFTSSCWGRFVDGGDSVLLPCEPAQCCWEQLRVCAFPNDSLSYTVLNSYAPDEEDCYFYPYPCEFVCDPSVPPSMPTGLEPNINPENGFVTTVYPNPSNGWLYIKFGSSTEGTHSLEVFDISGVLLMSKEFNKNTNDKLIQLNMNDYANGNYHYVIKSHDSKQITGSFIIKK